MLRRCLAAFLGLFALAGIVAAEDYAGAITQLNDSNLTLQAQKKGQKESVQTKLTLADRVEVIQRKAKGAEDPTTLASLRKRVARAKDRGILAAVSTGEDGKVVKIRIFQGGRMPEKVAAILAKAEQIEFYSLDPDENARKEKGKEFHGWRVLGKTVLQDARAREDLVGELDEAFGRGAMAKCFEPRHGIRAKHEGQSVDLVICFACATVYIYYDGKDERAASTTIDKVAEPAFDKILKDAKVPLPRPAEK
jgi:hypothetical protein